VLYWAKTVKEGAKLASEELGDLGFGQGGSTDTVAPYNILISRSGK